MRGILFALVFQTAAPALTPDSGDSGGDGSGSLIQEITSLLREIREFNSTWTEELSEALEATFREPFQELADALIDILIYLFTHHPSLTTPDLVGLHGEIFQLALLLSAGALVWIGVLHLTNQIHGARPVIYLVAALAVGGVAPWFLDLLVQLAQSITISLKPAGQEPWSVVRVSVSLIIITVVNSAFLLAIVVLYTVRDVFLMFTAVTAPLLGLMFVFPYTRRYAASMLGAFGAFLIIGPLNMIVFRLILIFIEADAGKIPQWPWVIGGFALMLGIPYIVLTAGLAAVGQAQSLIGGSSIPGTGRIKDRALSKVDPNNKLGLRREGRRKNRFRRNRRRKK